MHLKIYISCGFLASLTVSFLPHLGFFSQRFNFKARYHRPGREPRRWDEARREGSNELTQLGILILGHPGASGGFRASGAASHGSASVDTLAEWKAKDAVWQFFVESVRDNLHIAWISGQACAEIELRAIVTEFPVRCATNHCVGG